MLLNNSGANTDEELFDGRRALPSRQLVSTLSSITNGFLFSTTPIILRILEIICKDVDPLDRIPSSLMTLHARLFPLAGCMGPLSGSCCSDTSGICSAIIVVWCLLPRSPSSGLYWGIDAVHLASRSLSLSLVPSSIPFLYGFSRIITGIGTGGSIPIAYTRTTESAGQTEVTASSAFLLLLQSTSWLLGPTVLFVVLRFVDASSHRLTRTLQVVLLVASIPSLVSAIVLLRSSQTIIYRPLSDKEEVDVESRPPPRKHPPLRRAFLATGVCWFLYDLNVLFSACDDD